MPSVKHIGASCFEVCRSLTSLCLTNVNKIRFGAFSFCDSLVSVSTRCEDIEDEAFYQCANLRTAVIYAKELKQNLFHNCQNLKMVFCMNEVEKVLSRAFMNCSSLETVLFAKNVKEIEDEAFANCISLKKLKLPKNCKYDAERINAFYSSKGPIDITLY